MRVLLVNKFFFRKGGAESVFFATADLLRSKGHETRFFSMTHESNYPCEDGRYFVSPVGYDSGNIGDKARSAGRLLYSFEAKKRIEQLLADERPDVAHLHNIYHQISPSILHVLKRHRIPTVMTLHDFKMVCPSYSLLSSGKVCEKCGGGRYFNCFREKCMKDSRAKSLLSACEMYLHHRIMKVYDLVDCFLSPSLFLIEKMKEMGFRKKILYLPNFVDTDCLRPTAGEDRLVIYFGRLSREKGLSTLVTAMKGVEGASFLIVGDGPVRAELEKRIAGEAITNIRLLGYRSGEALRGEIGRAAFGIVPSECYENSPMSILELFALGKPAVGSRIGGIPELIKENERGLLFEPGNPDDLRDKIVSLLNDPEGRQRMGRTARAYVEREMSPEGHYRKLIEIYGSLAGARAGD
jgi:glycosyltransferase involved in cell wall biosynthesis